MHPLDGLASLHVNRDVVLTIGVFDGVHLGHQHLIGEVVRDARHVGGLAVVLTFHPHPQLLLKRDLQPAYLTTLEDRRRMVAGLGIDLTLTLRFTAEMALVTAREFVTGLCRACRLTELKVGPDFAMGHKRQGTIPVLRELGDELGFKVSVAEPWEVRGTVVSSTRVRELIGSGDVALAARLLGRHHVLSGPVVEGAKRGRTLGFPTANIDVDSQILLPADGVYAVRVCLYGRSVSGLANIGRRPTFDNNKRTVEVHLLDFAGDLYGDVLAVEFVHRLRDEVRFSGSAALVAQMQTDAALARALFSDSLVLAPCAGA